MLTLKFALIFQVQRFDNSYLSNFTSDDSLKNQNLPAYNSIEAVSILSTANLLENMPSSETYNAELAVLDLYCGCGGMSTGLCLGAKLSCVNLVTVFNNFFFFNFHFHCIFFITISCLKHVMALSESYFLALIQRWALDSDKSACESLKLNHPETQVSIPYPLLGNSQFSHPFNVQ